MKAKNSGFTLMEVLLSVMISSIILLSLYSTWTTGMQLGARHNQSSELLQEISWTYDQFEKDLGRMVDYDFSGSYKEQKAFDASADSIVFIVAGDDGLNAVRYSLESADPGERKETKIGKTTKENVDTVMKSTEEKKEKLILSRTEKDFAEYLSTGFTEDDPREILLEDLNSDGVSFSFASSVPGAKTPVWKTSWLDDELPQSIRFEIELEKFSELNLPPHWRRDFFLAKGFSIAQPKADPPQGEPLPDL